MYKILDYQQIKSTLLKAENQRAPNIVHAKCNTFTVFVIESLLFIEVLNR